MALKIKNITDVLGLQVFTDIGDYFGDIEEAVLANNRVHGWRIKATRGSFLSKILNGAKGVIVPHQYVKAIGDIVIISKAAIPAGEDSESFEEETY